MRYVLTFFFAFCGLAKLSAQNNIQWIANAAFSSPEKTALYDLCNGNNPVILAVGNIRSRATEHLLEAGTLQTLQREHGAAGDMYSMDDLRVAFLNITVFPGDEEAGRGAEIPVYSLPEMSESLNAAGWATLYNISTTGLFLLTPDHLVYPLSAATADGIYAEARTHITKLLPANAPDIRLLAVRLNDAERQAVVTVQNFSNGRLEQMRITLLDAAGNTLLTKNYPVSMASLEAQQVSLSLPHDVLLNNVRVVASVAGDVNVSNNVWKGSLQPEPQFIAATGDRK